MKGSYLWNVGGKISEIRLIVEGAAALYEEDARPLHKLALDSGELIAAVAIDTIGEALYELRTHIREMQEAHTQEVVRAVAEETSTDK